MRPPRIATPTTDLLDELENDQWAHARDPHTGELLYDDLGQPIVHPKSAAQKAVPVVRKWLWLRLMVRVYALSLVILFVAYVAGQLFLPDPVAAVLKSAFTVIAYGTVWTGLGLVCLIIIGSILRVLKGALTGR